MTASDMLVSEAGYNNPLHLLWAHWAGSVPMLLRGLAEVAMGLLVGEASTQSIAVFA